MYPSSSSTLSSHKNMPLTSSSGHGLIRYGSAPGSLLSQAVDAVLQNDFSGLGLSSQQQQQQQQQHPQPSLLGHQHHNYLFSGDSSSVTSESNCGVNANTSGAGGGRLNRSLGFNEIGIGIGTPGGSGSGGGGGGGGGDGDSLARQRSSPAGFLSQLVSDNTGFSLGRGTGSYNVPGSSSEWSGAPRLKTQLSFTTQDSLISQISDVSRSNDDLNHDNGHQGTAYYNAAVGTRFDPWEHSGSIDFSSPQSKRARSMDGQIFTYNQLESQGNVDLSCSDRLIQIPENAVPCKLRAKRGFATHPRSVAERERRIRISRKMKNLRERLLELVPDMEKQTSQADMLDLAVQNFKALQNEVKKLRQALENCTCGCKENLEI